MAGVVKSITAVNGRIQPTPTHGTVDTVDITDDAVTFAKVQNIATSRLLGRTTASSGDIEELTVGSGLTLSAGSLTASGGAGSPLTTKGDLYTFSTVNDRLAVGTNGKFLKADSGAATGLAWASLTGSDLTGFTAGRLAFGSAGGGLTGDANLSWDATNGLLAVGMASATNGKTEIQATLADPASGYAGQKFQTAVTLTAAAGATTRGFYAQFDSATATHNQGSQYAVDVLYRGFGLSAGTTTLGAGLRAQVQSQTTSTGAYTALTGFVLSMQHFGTGTVGTMSGSTAAVELRPSGGAVDGNVTAMNGYRVTSSNLSTAATPGVVGTLTGFEIATPVGPAAFTTVYGFRARNLGASFVTSAVGLCIDGNSGASRNVNALIGTSVVPVGSWSIYNSSTLQNYFAGNLGRGVTAPTAGFHMAAGTATANTAPLKFNSGTNLTAAEAGAMEYNNQLFFTESDGTRRNVLQAAAGKVAGAVTNDGHVVVRIGGVDVKLMTAS